VKELRKLPKEIAERIVKRVDIAKDEPKHFLEKLVDDTGYKIRVGDYRAIIDILDKEKILAVRIVGHRKNIYKRHL
jgi:mRNA interferase RelE/StbE